MKTFTIVAAAPFTTDAGPVEHGAVLGTLQLASGLPLANLTSLLRTGLCVAILQDDASRPAAPPAVPVPEKDGDPLPEQSEPSDPATETDDPQPEADAPETDPTMIGDDVTLLEAGVAKKHADLYAEELGIETVGQLRLHVADGGSLEDPDGIGPVTAKTIAALLGM